MGVFWHSAIGICQAQIPLNRTMAKKEKRSEWNFAATKKGEWRWRVVHPDGTEVRSIRLFTVLKDCIADASRHGYIANKPKIERRKST
ncbi:MAG: hypothetical protein QOK44_3694 [Betaproteobacteria bacterium]|jgi:hypothetical protein|nr:hypothetical protein [Betaproteobacteria bacterium]